MRLTDAQQILFFMFLGCVASVTLVYSYASRAQDLHMTSKKYNVPLRQYSINTVHRKTKNVKLLNGTMLTTRTTKVIPDQSVKNWLDKRLRTQVENKVPKSSKPMRDQTFTHIYMRIKSQRENMIPRMPSYKQLHDLGNGTHPAPGICPPKMKFTVGLPATALFSFPGSGNTWVRHLLQLATGVSTGSIYVDKVLQANGFPGEGHSDGTVVVTKTHEVDAYTFSQFDRAVLIIREPAAAILAEFNRQHKGHTGHADSNELAGKAFHETFLRMVEDWRRRNTVWLLEFPGPLHIIDYSDLQENLSATLTRVLHFLNWQVTDDQLDCVAKHQEGEYHRTPTNINLSDIFGKRLRQQLEEYKRNISFYIQTRINNGYVVSY